jgi:C4-dicarboxylate-specific signal transduction histidine kinase
MQPPSTLRIRSREIRGEIVRTVTVSGPGIAAHKLGVKFNPFVTAGKEGLGMEFALSRSIVNAPNGRLWAKNNPWGGEAFLMALPIFRP